MSNEPEPPAPAGGLLIYRDGGRNLQVRIDGRTVWLTQAAMAELFQTTPQNITMHVADIYAEGEQVETATCKDFLQVRAEGAFAELQARTRRPMHMSDWIAKLDDFLKLSDQCILSHAGRISHEQALLKAENEYETFRIAQGASPQAVDHDFEQAVGGVKKIEDVGKKQNKRHRPRKDDDKS